MISAEDAAATLRLLIPGFVALKVFYVFGLKTRRSDLEWTLWSLVAAAIIDGALNQLIGQFPTLPAVQQLVLGLAAALLAGMGLVGGWRLWIWIRPDSRAEASRMVWDAILPEPHWIQVWTTDGKVISGQSRLVASSVETDDLDLYLTEPAWIAGTKVEPMVGVEGFLIARDRISFIQVMSPEASG